VFIFSVSVSSQDRAASADTCAGRPMLNPSNSHSGGEYVHGGNLLGQPSQSVRYRTYSQDTALAPFSQISNEEVIPASRR
jgi:hypothetical protein